MSRPNKLERYADNFGSDNVLEPEKELYNKVAGNWSTDFFRNDFPITVELACGRGEYTIGLAQAFPERNFIGIDLKGDRIWKGSQLAKDLGLGNVCFVRSRIELIPQIFAPGEVSEIWLTFPDPRPKDRDEKHRLNNLFFMNMYRSVLANDGWFRFKTDNTGLFEYGLKILDEMSVRDLKWTKDLYKSDFLKEHHGIQTRYEKIWTEKGETIKYLKCRFN